MSLNLALYFLIAAGSFAVAFHDQIPDPTTSRIVLGFGILAIVDPIVTLLFLIAQRSGKQ